MVPYYSFNPLSKFFLFFPDQDIFTGHPKTQKTLNYTVFYDIDDGYYHVPLKFNISVKRPDFKFNVSHNDNTAPFFVIRSKD